VTEAAPPADAQLETRDAWDGDAVVATPVYARERMPIGATIAGPAVIEQYDTTTYVAPDWRARVDAYANLLLEDARA
jgi:N-methylhydantoinase A